ncbi:MAG: tRNA epoxyqueuosine(34) reductase QueG, partial [bacterium]
ILAPREVKALSAAEGFDAASVAPVGPASHGDAYLRWLAGGHAGTMAYLERQVEERLDLSRFDPWARSVICVAKRYGRGTPHPYPLPTGEREPERGKIARYAMEPDYHLTMTTALWGLLGRLALAAGRPVRGRAVVDAGPILERELAQRAGHGWQGKHTLLIHPKLGSYIYLGELLVDLELAVDEPWEADWCGSCRRCIEACPTDAIRDGRVLEASRCIAYLTIEHKGDILDALKPKMGGWLFGCDICQEVCPWTRKAAQEGDAGPGTFPLDEVLALDAAGFEARFGGTPVTRAKRAGLQRNARALLESRAHVIC